MALWISLTWFEYTKTIQHICWEVSLNQGDSLLFMAHGTLQATSFFNDVFRLKRADGRDLPINRDIASPNDLDRPGTSKLLTINFRADKDGSNMLRYGETLWKYGYSQQNNVFNWTLLFSSWEDEESTGLSQHCGCGLALHAISRGDLWSGRGQESTLRGMDEAGKTLWCSKF